MKDGRKTKKAEGKKLDTDLRKINEIIAKKESIRSSQVPTAVGACVVCVLYQSPLILPAQRSPRSRSWTCSRERLCK